MTHRNINNAPHWEPEEEPAVAAATQLLYLQALNACVRGDMAAADAQLAMLGCKWRLSQAVWAAAAAAAEATDNTRHTASAAQQQQQHQCYSGGSGVLLHDAPLPPALLHALQQAFHSSSSDFWSRHNYGDDDTPFFSYIIDLQAVAALGPSNALEAATLLLQKQLKQLAQSPTPDNQQQSGTSAAAAAAAATHVEWWAHTRPGWAPHQLHFDAAEGAFRRGLAAFRLAHPAAGSVLYLTGVGGPTLVLAQTTAAAVTQAEQHDVQQQQQHVTQQQPLEGTTVSAAAAAAGGDNGAPAAKRHKGSEQPAGEAAGAVAAAAAAADEQAQYTHKHRHHRHHHHHRLNHSEHDQQEQQRPLLASQAWLVAPAAGRFAVWPGNLLHGVLPGAVMPQGDDAEEEEDAVRSSQQQQQQQQSLGTQGAASSGSGGGEGMPSAGGASDAFGDARTTLILAWWSCDPRRLVTREQQQQQPSEAADTAQGAQAQEAAALPAGGGSTVGGSSTSSSLGPCMTMPALESSDESSDAAPVWLQALAHVPAADLAAARHADAAGTAAGAAGGVDGSHLAGWRFLPACCPAWEQVQLQPAHAAAVTAASVAEQPGAAAAAAAVRQFGLPAELVCHPMLCRAELPCLRFFLRSSRDIRAAYIPDFEAWQQQQQQQQQQR